jgi:hypothetical protein
MTLRCPLHIGIEMKLEEVRAPKWLIYADDAEDGEPRSKERTRKFWKCPVAGCLRVAAYRPTDEEEKEMSQRACPSCGAQTDVDGICRAHGNNLCTKCRREKWAARKQRREAMAGLGPGFYQKAKALRSGRLARTQEAAA